MSLSSPGLSIGVGFDTARYGHHVCFLRPDLQPAAKSFHFPESQEGYAQVRQVLEQLQARYGQVHFHMRLDAAGQYAVNLEGFLRSLPFRKTISIGEPKRNRDYCKVHFPKRKADAVESQACARFALVEQPPASGDTPAPTRQLQELAGALQGQIKQRTRLVNQLHNRLARVFPELPTLAPDLSASWVLRLLAKYPSASRIAAARLESLAAIPYLGLDKAQQIQAAARQTVGSLQGPVIEGLIRQSVRALQHSQRTARQFKQLLIQAYEALPPSPHRHMETIKGIGKQTAAALMSKIIDLERFATPESLVNYFGIFPEENTSGTDQLGRRVPPGTMHMSRKGNDLVRAYLWNAAKVAIRHNPVIRAFYARKRAHGKRGDVALGHCMQKLLHLIYAVWKTDQPFAPRPANTPPASAVPPPTPSGENKETVGRKGQSPVRKAVTTASSSLKAPPKAVKPAAQQRASSASRGTVDYPHLRAQVSMEQVLEYLGHLGKLKGSGCQRRGPCPVHASSDTRSDSFSVHLTKKIFQCFHPSCAIHGNLLDLWAAVHRLPLYEAACHLARTFNLDLGAPLKNREEEPVARTRETYARAT